MLARNSSGAALIGGIALLAKVSGASRIWAAAPTGATRQFGALAAMGKTIGLRVMYLPNEYPLADPTMLLYRLLNRRLRPRRLPVEQGVVLFDAAAAVAAGRAAGGEGEAMLTVPLAVHDHVRGRSHFATVPVGTPLSWALKHLHAVSERDLIELRGGALLRDVRLDLASCVVAGAELAVHVSLPSRAVNPDPCIRCSWCVEGCPTRIHPAGLLEAAQQDNLALAERYGIEACIECGVCSYVCPSHLPLLEGIRKIHRRVAQPVEASSS
jgi:electron transport complex protein RnfC